MSKYGFIQVPRELAKAIPVVHAPTPQKPIELPSSKFGTFIYEYARAELPPKVLNHSLRVYQYCAAIIKDQFPEWDLDLEVVFTTAMLHDIATTEKNMKATKLSFEFYGGLISRDLIFEHTGGNQDYAEAVAEAVIRHQNLGDVGFITSLGLIIQIATILDNVGLNLQYIHPQTLHDVNEKYLREGWAGCFGAAIDNENRQKPWGHTSQLGPDKFRDDVLGNKLKYSL